MGRGEQGAGRCSSEGKAHAGRKRCNKNNQCDCTCEMHGHRADTGRGAHWGGPYMEATKMRHNKD
eukprot:4753368-Alexandrium_andersonii.AAC.1